MKNIKYVIILLMSSIFFSGCFSGNDKELVGFSGSEADVLAKNVLDALNYSAWKELNYIAFTSFRGVHHYKWDKHQNVAEIIWEGNRVVMNLDTKEALVYQNSAPVTALVYKNALINEAWKIWNSDSFWLFAPFRLFDPGTTRSIVQSSHSNTQALKIEYSPDGKNTGNRYVWEINEEFMPISWKTWSKFIPLKGMDFTWEKWVVLPGGAKLCTYHSNQAIIMEIKDIKSSNSLADLGWSDSTFKYK